MASKRKLKKEVIRIAVTLFNDALLLGDLSTEEVAQKADELMDDIIVFTDDTLRRVHYTDGKDNPKLVKAYYAQLRRDIRHKEDEFNDRLTAIIEGF